MFKKTRVETAERTGGIGKETAEIKSEGECPGKVTKESSAG